MEGYERKVRNRLPRFLNDKTICKENRALIKKFFAYLEEKLKRSNGLRKLDEGCYKTIYDYIMRFNNLNKWFKNKPWVKLTKKDIQKLYNDLEDGKIKKANGEPYGDTERYYTKILKSKPFEMIGKADIAREVIQYSKGKSQEVRFITEEDFRKIVANAYKPLHRLLFWLAWDIGENITSLLRLRKQDFQKSKNPYSKEPEYRVNLRKEILKRSRRARGEITNHPETVMLLDQELQDLKDDELLFKFDYRNAMKIMDRCVAQSKVICQPKGEKPSWKDLRSGMACDLLKKGYSTDEVNARLGHKPSSIEIDKYVNFLALDRHKPKRKFHESEMLKFQEELEQAKQREKMFQAKMDRMKDDLVELAKEHIEMKKKLKG